MYKSRNDAPDKHRDSIEQLRAVGQTFVDGLSALRDRVSATTVTDSSSESGAQKDSGNSMSGNSDAVPPMGAETIPQESGDAHEKDQERMASSRELSAPSPGTARSSSSFCSPEELQREVDRLQNMLFATERKLEARSAECTDLKATAGRLGSRHERDMRQLETLRSEVRTARETGDIERERAERAVAEAARLRTELVDVERELARQTAECDELRRVSLGQKQKIAGLERVMMGLRRRVAMADGQVEAAKRAESAVAARHAAESALVEARSQLERFRARAVAVDSLRERAAAAERSEHELRDKVALLEREIESKDAVVRQDLAERRKLNEFMIRYEKQLEEKEATISSLRRQLRQLRVPETDLLETRLDDGRANASLALSETGSARSLTWDNGVGRNLRRAPSDSNFDSMGTDWADNVARDLTATGELGRERTTASPVALGNIEGVGVSRDSGVALVEASPLLRSVEEAYAQLQSAFSEATPGVNADDNTELLKRVKEVEAVFGALSYSHRDR